MITIFVSSTFRDMQAERDLLAKKVLPVIDEYARRRGETVSFIDLRWGIDTSSSRSEEESMRKILSVCLKEIGDAQPSFIAFIGERYGTIPEKELIANAIESGEDKDFRLDDMKKSITELEIEYGAFSKKGQPERCLFYFREPLPRELMGDKEKEAYLSEDEEHRTKLENLKNNLVSKAESSVRSYTCEWDPANKCVSGLDKLEEMLKKDLKAMLDDRLGEEKQLSWQERELRDAWLYLGQKARLSTARKEDFMAYASSLSEDDTKLLIIQDVRGSGKSTAMGSVAVMLREMGVEVMPFACGMSAGSSSAFDIVKQGVYFMEGLLGKREHFGSAGPDSKEKSFEDWKKAWEELLYEYFRNEGSRVAFVIDAMDQLIKDDVTENMLWLPALPKGVTIATSCLDTFKLPGVIELRERVRKESLREMSAPDKWNVLLALDKLNHKELSDELKDKLIGLPGSSNPLYLSMLYQRFVMMDSDDFKSIEEIKQKDKTGGYLMGLVKDAPKDVDGACAMLLDEAASRINKEQSDYILRLLAASGNGLRESDIRAIFDREGLKYSVLDYSQLRLYMRPYFRELGDGRTDYAHESIRQGLLKKTDMNPEDRERINLALYKHLESLADSDPVHREEYVRFAQLCDKKEELVRRIEGYSEEDAQYAAATLRDVCLEDKGAWLCSVIDYCIDKQNIQSSFIKFITVDLFRKFHFSLSYTNSRILLDVLSRNIVQAKCLFGKTPSLSNILLISYGYYEMALIRYEQGRTQEAIDYLGKCDNELRSWKFQDTNTYTLGEAIDGLFLITRINLMASVLFTEMDDHNLSTEFVQRNPTAFSTLAMFYGNALEEFGKAETYLSIAEGKVDCGDLSEAMELLQKTLDLLETGNINKQSPMFLDVSSLLMIKISEIEEQQGLFDKATEHAYIAAAKFKTIAERTNTSDSYINMIMCNSMIARILAHQGRIDDSVIELQKCLEMVSMNNELLGFQSTGKLNISIYKELGDAYLLGGRYKESLECFQKSLSFIEKAYKEKRFYSMRTVIEIYVGIADSLMFMDRYEEAIRNLQKIKPCINSENDDSRSHFHNEEAIIERIVAVEIKRGNLDRALDLLLGQSNRKTKRRYPDENQKYHGVRHRLLASIYFEQRELDLALKQYRISKAALERLVKEIDTFINRAALRDTYLIGAEIYEMQGELIKAKGLLAKSKVIDEREQKERETYSSLSQLGTTYCRYAHINRKLGNIDEALEYLHRGSNMILQLGEHSTTKDLRNLSIAYSEIADIKVQQDLLDEALELNGKCLEIHERLAKELGSPESRMDLSNSYNSVGGIYYKQNRYDKALEMHIRSLEINEQLAKELGTPDRRRSLGRSCILVGHIYEMQGRYDEALKMYLRGFGIFEQIAKELEKLSSLKDFATSCIMVGETYTRVNKPSEAIGMYRRSAALVEVIVEKEGTPENHAQLASVYEKAAKLCYEMQLFGESKVYNQKHLQILNILTTEVEHPMLRNEAAILHINLYVLCMNLEQKEEAEAYLKDALVIAEENCLRYPDEELLKETLEYIRRVLAGSSETEHPADK